MAVKTIDKLTKEQLQQLGVQALADRPNRNATFGQPGLNAESLKKWFDQIPGILMQKVNQLIDKLAANDAPEYIRINLDTLDIYTLQDLVNSFTDGTFASNVLKAKESADSNTLKTLQVILNGIAESIATENEAISTLEFATPDMSKCNVTTSGNTVTIVLDNADETNTHTYTIDLVVGTSRITDQAVTTPKIKDGAVTTGKLDTGAVTTEKITNSAVTTNKINDGAVTTDKIGGSAVVTGKIADSAVTTEKIAQAAVEEGKIKDGAVTTGKVNAGAITEVKLASGVSSKLNGAFKSISYNSSTGVLTLTKNNDNTVEIDLPTELIISTTTPSYYDDDTESIVLVLANGNEISIPLTTMLADIYSYVDGIREKIFDLQEAPPLSALESALVLTTPTLAQLADLST